MRKKIAAGNWKMNLTWSQAYDLCSSIVRAEKPSHVTTLLAVPYVFLQGLNQIMESEESNTFLAAQNVHQKSSGAYTGEVSVDMLKSIGIQYVVLGHSERREYNHESDELLYEKLKHAHHEGMIPIFCCGEPLEIRKTGKHKEFVVSQLEKNLLKISAKEILNTIVAYEPIWAIGTGETASPAQAQEMHYTIREAIAQVFGGQIAQQISILYGGSVKGSNAAELFANEDVDGGLVGGASLNSEDFIKIINAFS